MFFRKEIPILLVLIGTLVAAPSFAFIRGGDTAISASGFTGFLDQYATQGATWGVSAYKLTNAYAGNWGTVKRQSDGTTQTIGFLSNGKVNVAAFNTFCSGTNCFLSQWVDQVNGLNTTDASATNFMPRVIVDQNNLLAVCPQPGSKATTAFSSLVNTSEQHLFTVARLGFADSRWSQPNVPTIQVTADVTASNLTVTNMSSQTGIQPSSTTGVNDSAGDINNPPTFGTTGQAWLSALPTGTTGTLAFQPGFLQPSGSTTGDTLTITNPVQAGVLIMNGAAAQNLNGAYWGFGIGTDGEVSDTTLGRNGANNYNSVMGNGMRSQWGVWDTDTFTTQINYNGVNLGGPLGSTANITYSTNTGMTLFSDNNGAEQLSQSCFETIVLFPATESSRTAMAQFLMAQDSISFPFAANTSDGFAMTGLYQPLGTALPTSVYGTAAVGPDVYGLSWNMQSGGYTWPSISYATNINNSTTLWRFIVEQGDSDMNITGSERSEINVAGSSVTPGNSFSFAYQLNYEQLPSQSGSWCYGGQVHYNDANTSAPDLITFSCENGQAQFVTQKTVSGSITTTNCGSPQTLTAGVTYAVVGTGFWSSNHTSDTIDVYWGQNGTTLSHVCSASGTLWDNDTGAYLKAGIYRGYPWENQGTVILRQMNLQWSPTTANAYNAQITTQLPLPTHP